MKTAAGWAGLVVRAVAFSVEVFLHDPGSFGERYLRVRAVAAAIIIFFFPIFWDRHHNVVALMGFLLLFLIACGWIRLATAIRIRKGGWQPHSYYNGRPTILRYFKRLNEEMVKTKIEPFLTFLIGALLMPVSEPLGGYWLLASVALLASTCLTKEYERTRALNMNDAYLDQKHIAERFREFRGD